MINPFRVEFLFLSLFLIMTLSVCAQNDPDQEEWIPLFNGKDLSGWDIHIAGHDINDNYKNTFLVEEGILKINYDEYEDFGTNFGHIYYQTPYSYYLLRAEYRFVGEQTKGGATWNVRNSGIMIHSQSVHSLGRDQHFPVSIEIQLLGGLDEGDRPTANICTPGTRLEMEGELINDHCINSDSKTYHGDQWVEVGAVVLGDSLIHHSIEGETVITYQKPQIDSVFIGGQSNSWESFHVKDPEDWIKRAGTLLTGGYIALQAESHPIHFRKLEILNLEGCMDPKATNYKSYFIKSDNSKCKYD